MTGRETPGIDVRVMRGRTYTVTGTVSVFQTGLVDRSYFEELAKHGQVIAIYKNEQRLSELTIRNQD
jgi:hypothetical protein